MSDIRDTRLERVPSGITGLDTILNGGFFKGGLYIIEGTPGIGKTILAHQICFSRITAGGRALYTTLLSEYHARMMQHLTGMSFFDASKIPDQFHYIGTLHVLRQDGPKGLLTLLRREIMACNATILIVDGFATAQRVADSEQDLAEFVHELQGIAIATDCTMVLLTSAIGLRNTPAYSIVDGILELSERLVGLTAESGLQVIKLRGSGYLRGQHAFKITDEGLVVYPRIEALLARPSRPDPGGVETVASGIDRLDVMLGAGLPSASTTMIIGPSGIGKTTLGLQFLSRSSQAEPGLLFGFYETPARINAKVDMVCKPLRHLLETGVVEVVWQPPTDDLLDAYGDRLLQAVRHRGVRRLFIDGLGALRDAATDPARMGHFLDTLTNELRVQGVTTLYTLEVPDIMGPYIRAPISNLSSLAENLVLLRFIELRSRLYRLISILKVRDSDFDPSLHQFEITNQGLVIEENFESAETIMANFLGLPSGMRLPHGRGSE